MMVVLLWNIQEECSNLNRSRLHYTSSHCSDDLSSGRNLLTRIFYKYRYLNECLNMAKGQMLLVKIDASYWNDLVKLQDYKLWILHAEI